MLGTRRYVLLFEYIEMSGYDAIAGGIKKSGNYDFSNVATYGSPFSECEALGVTLGMLEGLRYVQAKRSEAKRSEVK